jgi:RNase H-like domain found in reverse transcriptase
LGAGIMQDINPFAFYSRKVNADQRINSTTEIELLSTFETCKEYANILFKYQIIVYTGHKDNTVNVLKNASDCELCWHSLL